MRLDPEGLREGLAALLRDDATESLHRHLGDESASSRAEVLARHDWVDSAEIAEARAGWVKEGALGVAEAQAFDFHLRRLRHARTLEEAPGSLDRLAEANERAGGLGCELDAAPAALCERAARYLEESAEAAREARERLGFGARPITLSAFEGAFDDSRLRAIFSRGERLRRIAKLLPGFSRELSGRVRVSVSTRARLAGPLFFAPPLEVRLLVPREESGLSTELTVAEALGRALLPALGSAGLPPSLRHPTHASVGRAFGVLLSFAVTSRPYTRRDERLRGGLGEHLAELGRGRALERARLLSLLTRVSLGEIAPEAALFEAEARLGLSLTREELARMLTRGLGPAPALRAIFAAEGLHRALVERYDEDFLLNPRIEEVIRAAGEPGALLTAEAWCTELSAGRAVLY